MSADLPITVTNNRQVGRLEVKLGEDTAFAEYHIGRGGITFPHTVVPAAFEGKGVGSALVKAGLKMAEEKNLPVIPLCSFFAGYIARHPEYRDQVHPRYRDRVETRP